MRLTLPALLLATAISGVVVQAAPSLTPYNVVWQSAGEDSKGSMPLGNGDIGLNVWVEEGGDLLFYISKTDAWGDDVFGSRGLPKVGRVRVKFASNPFRLGLPFRQILRLEDGSIQIEAGDAADQVRLNVWVDANHPVIHLEGSSDKPQQMQVSIDSYRSKAADGLNADLIFPAEKDSVAWCYRNTNKAIPELTNRTFGAVIKGANLVSTNDSTLKLSAPQKQFEFAVYPLTAQTATPDEWLSQLERLVENVNKTNLATARREHSKWWSDFWNRSWVIATGNADAEKVTRNYVLQRFVTACAGRGAFPIKFNGSLFTSDYGIKRRNDQTKQDYVEEVNADYRTWSGQYWFQNTRPMYWPMLQSGDFEMMLPLFRMYQNQLPRNTKAVRDYYGHDGAYFAETNPFWGQLPNIAPDATPSWTLQYYTPILELSSMMFDYYKYTGDEAFARKTLVPIANAGVTFFDQHFKREANGKLNLFPVNSIEMYWGVKNPAPDIAGLNYVLRSLLNLPDSLATPQQKTKWRALLNAVPPLPLTEKSGKKVLAFFESAPDPKLKNGENPELYAIYPFRLYGVGKPDLTLARDTFDARIFKEAKCWRQDPIQAAYLGNAATAKRGVIDNFSIQDTTLRFPVFWAPSNDYAPDQDNGGNGLNALQLMLLQGEDDKLILLPAWPTDWNAEFKLCAPRNTTVEAQVQNGKITSVKVTPASRRKDLFLTQPDGTLTPFK
ncbi:hypothetical protein EON83_21445 [bacterium]|nr:MAG: hypothetical protein EON83_21445 [bacterium]